MLMSSNLVNLDVSKDNKIPKNIEAESKLYWVLY